MRRRSSAPRLTGVLLPPDGSKHSRTQQRSIGSKTPASENPGRFTALRAKYIASHVKQGKTVIYPTGGHALVGHYTGTLNVGAAFLHTLVERE